MFKHILKTIKWAVILFMAFSLLGVLYYRWMPVRFTPLMGIRMVQSVWHGEMPVCHHEWVDLVEINPNLPRAVIASEDQKFVFHSGFDFEAIQQVIKEREEGRRFRGGSTITQQTAKNVFLWPGGGWIRKGLEAWFTVLIELCWSKERIMEVYLNSIEMGPGIYGAEAVANEHFNTTASRLSREDCALIAATLPNPLKFSSKNPSRYMHKRQKWILRQMKNVESVRKE